ncbi:BTAD domain-containing putative transcriptional regulator [Streptomyces sp. NPDC093600]|uniref:BTAD domain-containing putative transcriptional regulator n=1 Tax=Streptomyces sp. NPDC093600 TaxID=3366047 RepID=UPI0038022349
MRYLILGSTQALDPHGTPLPLGGVRLRALLAALALRAGRPASVTELVDDIYGDEPPHDAPAALQALVGRLRRAIGRDAVASAPGVGYRLVARPDDIDLYVFERRDREAAARLDAGDPDAAAELLRGALALFRGPALADLPEHARVRPEAQRLAALRRRVEADLRRGALDGLVPELSALTTAHPYDEGFRAQLVRALRDEGRQADALAAFEDARRALADGLGADPGPELLALHRELLQAPPEPRDPGNIRPRLTSFVGREPELAAIRADLTRSRLVTLTGPGGSGKTRLAEEAALAATRTGGNGGSGTGGSGAWFAAEAAPAATRTGGTSDIARTARTAATRTGDTGGFGSTGGTPASGAWLAELAPLDDPDAVPGAVLSALGLRETNLITRDGQPLQDDPTARLVEHLAHRPLLLVLDNCEHVIDAAAALAETLLTHCPRLRILATSREPLGVPGETVRPVEPLPPHPAHLLFAERARAVRPDFRPDADLDAVDEICRRLDGLPLAIELAAARLRLLTPRQIADRLDDRFALLTSGSRTVLPRQQTLRAVVDWSWDLLEPDERTLLRQVSVFAGGWDLPAAEALGAAHAADALGALVDKSLVVAAPTDDGEMRYRLLETIHEYASERAAETPGLLAAAEAAHTAHYTALVEEAEPRLRSGEQLPWIRRIETDLDNIRAALHRTVLTAADEPSAHRLVLAMGWFWWLRNYRPEGLAWAERALRLGTDPDDPADPRHWPRMRLHMLRFFLAVESHTVGEFSDDPELAALVRRVRAAFADHPGPESARFPGLLWPFTAYLTEKPDVVRAMLDASVAHCRRHGGEWEIGVSLMFRTHMAVDMPGGMTGIDEDLAELRALSRRVGDRWMRAQVASAAAEANMLRGRHAEAGEAYEEALQLAREVGAHAEAPFLIARLAEIAFRAGDMEAAEKGLDEACHEAERSHVNDARTYIGTMRALIALHRGDVPGARARLDEARRAVTTGAPPPHFAVVLSGLDARIRADEGGGTEAVADAVAALRTAREAQCADFVIAALAECVAITLSRCGAPALAVRALAAADTWRGALVRSVPEAREAEALTARAREALGEDGYAEAYASGAALDVEAVLTQVEAYVAGSAPSRTPT